MEVTRAEGALDENPLLRDVAFNRHSMRTSDQISPFDNGKVDVGFDGIKVNLIQGIDEENFHQVVGRAVLATIGVDPDRPPEEMPWAEMLKGGLQTALESQVIVFELAGISRALTHQLVRHRRWSMHQQSMRAAYMGDHPDARMPEAIWRNETARKAFLAALEACHHAYRVACENDLSYQDARYALPIATQTYILLEMPLREFISTYAYRACSMFMAEMVYVMREMGKILVEVHPWLADSIKISCEKPQRCTYQGVERVEGQCDFPWAREETRTYKPSSELKIGK